MKISQNNLQLKITYIDKEKIFGAIISFVVGLFFVGYYLFAKYIPIEGLEKNPSILFMLAGLYFGFFGVLFTRSIDKIQTILNKTDQSYIIKSKLILGNSVKEIFKLTDVKLVENHLTKRQKTYKTGSPRTTVTAELRLVLNDQKILIIGQQNKVVDIAHSKFAVTISPKISNQAPLEKEAKIIAYFIGVKVKQNEVPTGDLHQLVDQLLNGANMQNKKSNR